MLEPIVPTSPRLAALALVAALCAGTVPAMASVPVSEPRAVVDTAMPTPTRTEDRVFPDSQSCLAAAMGVIVEASRAADARWQVQENTGRIYRMRLVLPDGRPLKEVGCRYAEMRVVHFQ
jgi:hypothetical protein